MRRVGTLRYAVMAFATMLALLPAVSAETPPSQLTIDLHSYDFPAGTGPSLNIKLGVFYLSQHRIAVYFDRQKSTQADLHSGGFEALIFDVEGHLLARRTLRSECSVHTCPVDITAGPSGGLLFGRTGKLDFYDGNLVLARSMPLADAVTGINFDSRRDQLVVEELHDAVHARTARFLDGHTLQQSEGLNFPVKGQPTFGKGELVYTVGGDCWGAARFVSARRVWRSLESLPACDALTFVGDDALAYAFDQRLYVVDFEGKKVLDAKIPAPHSFESPRFVGLSDDLNRLAISALNKKRLSRGWPWYDELFVYDLHKRHATFRYPLPQGAHAVALSPDGHQLATIEDGTLHLIPLP